MPEALPLVDGLPDSRWRVCSKDAGPKRRAAQLKHAWDAELLWRQVTDANASEFSDEQKAATDTRPPWLLASETWTTDATALTCDALFKRWFEINADVARANEAITELLPRDRDACLQTYATFVEKIDAEIATIREASDAPCSRTPAWAAAQARREATAHALTRVRERYASLREQATRLWTYGPTRKTERTRSVPPLMRAGGVDGAAPADLAAAAPAAAATAAAHAELQLDDGDDVSLGWLEAEALDDAADDDDDEDDEDRDDDDCSASEDEAESADEDDAPDGLS